MSKYDNTDEEDKSKWLLSENWKDNFRFSSKNDAIKCEKCHEFLNHKKPTDEKTNKLVLSLNDKEKYVIHIRTLQFYLKQGLKLKKIHRAIEFEQKEVLKPYIEFNTEKRKNATNDFEKDVYKLVNNATFGKTMEDKRKHLDFEVVSDETRYMKCVSNPNFKHSHISLMKIWLDLKSKKQS